MFGGVTLQARTQTETYELFTRIHFRQHDTDGEEKFQYSVIVDSEELDGSLVWLVPKNYTPLLHRLLSKKTRATKTVKELKTLTEEGRASAGLGQYAQHTCCDTHSNAHLFPLTISREALRVDRVMRVKKSSSSTWDREDPATFGRCSIASATGVRDSESEVFTVRKQHGSTWWT